jgi:hypothetical protein
LFAVGPRVSFLRFVPNPKRETCEAAEKSWSMTNDPLEKVRWSLDAELRRALVRVYNGLVVFVQEPKS